MRTLSLLTATLLLTACGGGDPTCEELEIDETKGEYFDVDLGNESGGINVEFVPSTATDVWLVDDTNQVVWQVLCDTAEDADGPSPCLESPIQIGSDAPAGASNPVETQDLQDGPVYTAWVADYDVECAGQVRRGESQTFTVTIESPF